MLKISAVVIQLVLLAIPCADGRAYAQSGQADRLFESGIASFRAADYAGAAMAFGVVADLRGNNPRATAAGIMVAKSEYRAGRFDAALDRARRLLDRYPASSYAPDAAYIAALCEYRLGQYDFAASSATSLVRERSGTPFGERGAELFNDIVSSHLPLSELKRLNGTDLPAGLHAAAAMALAKAYVRRGEDSLAVAVLDDLRARPDAASSLPDIASLRDEISAGDAIQVAALLPLGGNGGDSDLGKLGSELLDGIRFAADAYNAGVPGGRKIEVVAHNIGRDSAAAAAEIRGIVAAGRVRAVVGPVFSEPFASASEIANAAHLPIISPTATADRLAAVGPFVFQANPDNETRGRAAARYAVEDLRMSAFAILASDDPVGRSHAAAFSREARSLGATVYCTVFFPPEATDLREEFLEVRRSVMADGAMVRRTDLLRPGVREAMLSAGIDSLAAPTDSAGATVSVTAVFGARGYAVAESLGLAIVVADTTAAELDIPMVTADGIFVALGDPGQLDYVAPQLNYFNIRAQVIGNNEWYDPDRLRDNRKSLEGAIFLSDFDDSRSDSAMEAFSSAFVRRHGRSSTKFTLYGYDTMSLLVEQVREGAGSRQEIARRLRDVAGFPGLHAPITLRDGRVNRNLHVMKYQGGRIIRIGSASGGER